MILSALGLAACGWGAIEVGDDVDDEPTSDSGPATASGIDSQPVDGGSCYTDTHDEMLCIDPFGGTTGGATSGMFESSGGGESSSGGAPTTSTDTAASSSGTDGGDAETSSGSTSGEDSGTSSGGTSGAAAICPPAGDVDESTLCPSGWPLPDSVLGPIVTNGQCCYTITCEATACSSGRPFVIGASARVATVRRRGDWTDAAQPCVTGLDPATREALAQAWLADAQAEHASIASFARFALELLSIGAPPDLIADAHAAAADEIVHARICFALASAYAGRPCGPGPLAMAGALDRCGDLYAILRATVEEGCVGETLAAIEAEAAMERAIDPVVRAALARIAHDEARHAALAWRVVAWALGTGAATVRRAVADGLAAAESALAERTADTPTGDAEGRLGRTCRDALVRTAWAEVLAPLGEQLLAS